MATAAVTWLILGILHAFLSENQGDRPGVLPPPQPVQAIGFVEGRPSLSPFHRSGWRQLPPEPVYGFARDRYGYMRPRIVLGPHGHAYYPLSGEPYLYYPIRTAP